MASDLDLPELVSSDEELEICDVSTETYVRKWIEMGTEKMTEEERKLCDHALLPLLSASDTKAHVPDLWINALETVGVLHLNDRAETSLDGRGIEIVSFMTNVVQKNRHVVRDAQALRDILDMIVQIEKDCVTEGNIDPDRASNTALTWPFFHDAWKVVMRWDVNTDLGKAAQFCLLFFYKVVQHHVTWYGNTGCLIPEVPETVSLTCMLLLAGHENTKVKVVKEDDYDRYASLVSEALVALREEDNPVRASDKFQSALDLWSHSDSVKSKLTPDAVLVLRYACALSSVIQDGSKTIAEGMEMLRAMQREVGGDAFPLLYYGLGRALTALYRFKDALVPVETGLHLAESLRDRWTEVCWPTSEHVIEESKLPIFKRVMGELRMLCHYPPAAHATCSMHVNHDGDGVHIYFHSPTFSGYTQIWCHLKCRITFHPQCWKHFKATIADKVADKDMLNQPCPTPNCGAVICKIFLCRTGSKGNKEFKSAIPPPKKAPGNHKLGRMVTSNPDKIARKAERREIRQQKRQEAQLLKDGSDEDDTAGVAESRNHLQEDKTEGSSTASVALTKLHRDQDQGVRYQGFHKSIRQKKKKEKVKHVLNVEVNFSGNREATLLGEDDADPEHNKTSNSVNDRVANHDPYKVPQRLQADVQRLDGMVAWTAAAQSRLANSTIMDNLVEFFAGILSEHGPLSLSGPLLSREMADLPEEAKRAVTAVGGPAGFFRQSLKFVVIGDVVANIGDTTRAHELARRVYGAPDSQGTSGQGRLQVGVNSNVTGLGPRLSSATWQNTLRSGNIGNFPQNTPYSITLQDFQSRTYSTVSQQNNQHQSGTANSVSLLPTVHPETFRTHEDFGNVSQTSGDGATAPLPLVVNLLPKLPKLSQAPGTVSQASGTSNDVSESVYENGTSNGEDSPEETTDWWSGDDVDVKSGKMPVADVDVYNMRSVADENLDYARTSVLRLNPAAPAFEPGQSRRMGERRDLRNSVDHKVQSNVGGSTNQKLAAACTDGNNVYGPDDHAVYHSNGYVHTEQTFSPHNDMYVHDDQTSCQSRNEYVDGNTEDWSKPSQQCIEDIDDIDNLSMAMHAPLDECLSDMDTIDDTNVLPLEDRYLPQSPSCSSYVMKEADGDMLSRRSSRSDLSQTSDISTGGLFHLGSTGSSASSLKGGSACDASSPHAGCISSPYAGRDMSSPHTGCDAPSPQSGRDVSSPRNRMREFSSSPQSVRAVSSSAYNSQGQGPSAVTGSDEGYCSVNTVDTGLELGLGENFAAACLDRSTLPQSDSPIPPSLSDSPPPPSPTSPQVGASFSVHEKSATLASPIGHKYSVGAWDSDCMPASSGQPSVDGRVGASLSNLFSSKPALSFHVNGMLSGVNIPQPLQPLAPILTPPFAVPSMPLHAVPQAAVVSVSSLPPMFLPPVLPTAISHVPKMSSIPTQSGVSSAYHSTVAQTSPSSGVSFPHRPSSEAWTYTMTRNPIVHTSSLLTSSYQPSLGSGNRETLKRGTVPPPIPLPAFSNRPGGNQTWTSDPRATSSEDKQLAEVGVQTEVATRSVQINTDMDLDEILRSYHALSEEKAELTKQLQMAADEKHSMQALVQQYQAEKIAVDRQLEEIRQERNKAVQQMNNLDNGWAREKQDLVENEAVLKDRIKSLQEQNSLSSLEKGNLLQRASEAEKRQHTETQRARSAEMEVVKLRMQLSVQQLELRKSESERHHQYTLLYAKRCQEKGEQVPDKLREVLKYWQAVVEAYNNKRAEIQCHYDNQLAELDAGKRLEDLPHVSFSPPPLPRMPEALAMLPMNGQPLALQGVSDAQWDPSRLSPPLFGSQAGTTTTGTAPNDGASHVPSSVTSSAPRPLVPPNPSMRPLRTPVSTTRPPLVPPLPLRPMATLSQASTALSTASGSASLGPVKPLVHAATSAVNSTGGSMHKGVNAGSGVRQPLRPPLSTTLSTPTPYMSGLYTSQHTDAPHTSGTGWVPATGVSGWVPVSDDHSAAGRGTVSQMAITSRPLPQTFNSVLTSSAPRTQVSTSAAPQSSFDKLVVTLQKSFPTCTRDDFSRLIQELRRAHGGSLSGMSLELIVTRITQMLIARGIKPQGALATEKSVNTPHSHKRVAPPPGLNPAWSVEGVDEERAPTGADRFQEEDPCAICVEELSAAPCITLECSHRFHDACLRKWYEHNSTCPNCRIYAPLHDEFPSLK